MEELIIMHAPEQELETINIANYCVAFFDLLGQRTALGDAVLLPSPAQAGEKDHFTQIIRESIGSIVFLQRRAEELIESLKPNPTSALKQQLPPEAHGHWDEMEKFILTTQRWSDGLVLYTCMSGETIKCTAPSIFRLFIVAGGLMWITLAARKPVRGSIEIGWGAELHEGELYGKAIAEAYELESKQADFPRIVIGPEAIKLLNTIASKEVGNVFEQLDSRLAKKCLQMIAEDREGIHFLDYLGSGFYEVSPLPAEIRDETYQAVLDFAQSQLVTHKTAANGRLVDKYNLLLEYLNSTG